MKTCVDFIIENNCPDSLICAINCASDTKIDTNQMMILPFNNYGKFSLRVRTCLRKVHPQKLERYSLIDQVACNTLSDFEVCSRWIPPSTFVPVALPINTTYIEIDSCETAPGGPNGIIYTCRKNDPPPSRIYGNNVIFPPKFDVAQTNVSVCTSNGKSRNFVV